jgi:dTDP-4-dehydrorhamnose reductase
MIRTIGDGNEYDHPALDTPGWWHRLDRLCYPPVKNREHVLSPGVSTPKQSGDASRSLLIAGANGTLGQAFARICEKRGLSYQLLSRSQMDIADRESVAAAINYYQPWAIVNAAGYVRVDDAEKDRESCLRENFSGPECLAKECAQRELPLVTFSSDLVFDGLKGAPYVESDRTAPLNIYGKSKAAAEERVLEDLPGALIIRTSAFFGPWDKFNFVNSVLETLSKGHTFVAAADVVISPTYVPDLVNTALDLLIDGENGIWHLANSGVVTWVEFARAIARKAGYEARSINGRPSAMLGLAARRPSFTALASERGTLMPSFEESLDKYFQDGPWVQCRSVAAARV